MPTHSAIWPPADLCLCLSHLSLCLLDLVDYVINDSLLFGDLPIDFLFSIFKCPLFLLPLHLDSPPDLLGLLLLLLLTELLHLQLVDHRLPLEAEVCQLQVFGLTFLVQVHELAFKFSDELPFLLQVSLEGTRDVVLPGMSYLVQVHEGDVFLDMLA